VKLLGNLIKSRMQTFRRDDAGVVMIVLALSIPIIFGAAAVSVDIGQLMYIEAELQSAADAAALAATEALDDEDEAKSLAVTYAELNMPVSANGNILDSDDVILGNWDEDTDEFTTDGSPTNAVKVTVRRATENGNAVELYFAKIIGIDTRDVEATATASTSSSDSNYCLLALSDSGSGALTLNGTPDLSMPDCGVAVASDDDSAFVANGNGELEASEVCVAGGSSVGNNATVSPSPTDNCSDIPDDPLDGLEAPVVGDCDQTNFSVTGSGNNVTLSPGVYCGGISVTGSGNTVTLESGEYIIDGGGISVNGGTFEDDGGGGVFIYNTSSDGSDYADISFTGNGTIELEAMTTGDYAGVLFFNDRDADSGTDFSIGGTSTTALSGAIYFPEHDVSYAGTSSQASSCIQIIADTITLSGTSEVVDPDGCDDSAITIVPDGAPRLRN
jgi:Flp pilus assembly protein TadG